MADGTESQVSEDSGADSHSGSEKSTDVHLLNTDTDRVARIVAALRKAHAEQAAASSATAVVMAPVPAPPAENVAASVSEPEPASASVAESVSDSASESASESVSAAPATGSATQTAEMPDAPAPRRETTGVRPAAPALPTLRWNPGARYRASRLADRPALPAASAAEPATPAATPASGPAGQLRVPPPPVPGPPVQGPPVPAHPVGGPPPLAGRLYRGPARRTGVFEREIWYPAARSSRVPRDVSDALVRAVERYRMGSISTSGLVRAIGRAHAA
ncbi:hypothetical protein [Promicromonospora panici]|uniref:hypothetical protein n=1 Tax=Promicromonospora panici TaxID=2219658 RepID=UPI00101D8DB3|nr:hypothetical protein [Promicromonospora panici]